MRLDRCTAQKRDGTFCDVPSAEDMPFPICIWHARQVYARLGFVVGEALNQRATEQAEARATKPPRLERERHQQFNAERIYTNREFFHPSDRLMAHIATIRATHGTPVLDRRAGLNTHAVRLPRTRQPCPTPQDLCPPR